MGGEFSEQLHLRCSYVDIVMVMLMHAWLSTICMYKLGEKSQDAQSSTCMISVYTNFCFELRQTNDTH